MQLIINTWGTYVHIKDELFEVTLPKDGEKQKHHFASQKVTSILMSKGAAISTDAIILAMKNNIDIIVFEYDGMPVGRFWHSKPGSTSRIRKQQLDASLNQTGVFWIKCWLAAKLTNQIEFLKRLKNHRPATAGTIQEKIDAISGLKIKIEKKDAEKIDEIDSSLRGFEGTAGRVYFQVLSSLLNERYQFEGRSFRPAKDPFNAFLNYAYGVLYSRVEKVLVIAGLDPYVGFMHRDDYNTKSMVFDFIEPYRIYADEVVFKLFSAKKVNDSHTDSITNGISLNAEGKNLLMQSLMKFLDEDKIRYKGRNQTRMNAMQMDAHQFANRLIQKL
ncbi:CRISPR-associated endonuclease Cas1 [Mariniphaga sediminis]|uniref:CRISPR-associated endonuclease Cas1 n=1 Tax=Mariniphaga sediminis TaxID=1628158 RepID=A0A399D5K1_9BACT|nr:CRISPR-associated endonuclease Cas1 [Mariniphaga sediminis]RIH67164.1 CRISPR-associated endonuclease Cas1 [Mariniphaga sediminis]